MYIIIVCLHDISSGGWAAHLPPWLGSKKERGLLGWGDTAKNRNRTPLSKMQKKALLDAIDKYFETIGLPPTQVGENMARAIATKRYVPSKNKRQNRWGTTKGQAELIPLQPPHSPINLQIVYVTVVTAYYNKLIKPTNTDGTKSSTAVFGFLMEKKPLSKLLAIVRDTYPHGIYTMRIYNTRLQHISARQMKSKLQKLGNKAFICNIAKRYLNPWVRKGNFKLRLKVVRDLSVPQTLPDDETFKDPKEMFQDFAYALVQTLVEVGKGEHRIAKTENAKEYVLYPYGSKGAQTYEFKTEIPDSYFATTLTELYPFIVSDTTDTVRWEELLKKCHHPMTKL